MILLGPGSTNAQNYPSLCGSNTLGIALAFRSSVMQVVIGQKLAFRSKYTDAAFTDWYIS